MCSLLPFPVSEPVRRRGHRGRPRRRPRDQHDDEAAEDEVDVRRSASRHLLGICGARCPIALPCMHSMTPFLTFLQLCLCSSGHQERARAVERRGRRFRRFFAVRKDVRKVGGAFATPDRQIFFLQWQQACSALQVLAALRRDAPGRRAAAPAGRRIAEACARSWDTGSRRPYRCRALACAHCCTLHALHGCRDGGMLGRRGGRVGAGCALRGLARYARVAPRGPLSLFAYREAHVRRS